MGQSADQFAEVGER